MYSSTNKLLLYIHTIAVFLLYPLSAYSADYLFKNKKTSYRIVVAPDASVTEKTAARELGEYLEQISGAEFVISNIPGKKNIYIGYNESYAVFEGITPFQPGFEGFAVQKKGYDLVIYGGRDRGTMFGVYRFLNKYLGVRWYTPDFTKVPSMRKYLLSQVFFSEEPRIKYRYTDFFCSQDIPWLAHNTMNTMRDVKNNVYGMEIRYWGVHSLGKFIPSSKLYKTHPEYFALRKGQRLDSGQPCLSNPEVFRIVINELLSVIEKYPYYLVYDVSQLDNERYCTCASCTKLEKIYGGHSGIMIWFVNQVAREVKKKYPDKNIGTFAYQYTRHAPTNIKPEDNVVVRLCDIECCFVHPLSDNCNEHNAAFMKDLEEWSKLTKNIYIWDYIVNYSNYMTPFPNIQVLGPNLKTFAEYGAIEVFEEAQSGSLGNAFEEMKCWVLAQLMWNPDLDVDKLVSEFVYDYYGSSAKDILEYYKLCQSLICDKTHLTCFTDPRREPFTDQFIKEAYKILNRAIEQANTDTIVDRVRKVMLQPMALECVRHPQQFYKEGKWPDFKSQILKYKSNFKAGQSPEKFIESYESKFN